MYLQVTCPVRVTNVTVVRLFTCVTFCVVLIKPVQLKSNKQFLGKQLLSPFLNSIKQLIHTISVSFYGFPLRSVCFYGYIFIRRKRNLHQAAYKY